MSKISEHCTLCPRKCGVNRPKGEVGFCNSGTEVLIASFGRHFGEEPCISGEKGSGTVFFADCNMRCVYCQNFQISQNFNKENGLKGENVLSEIMILLQEDGCENLNLVTPTHFLPQIVRSLYLAVSRGFSLPLVYNCGGYENPKVVDILEGAIDIYMPDIKYFDEKLSNRYSLAPDYFQNALRSLEKMTIQTGNFKTNPKGLAKRGVILRHLVLPGLAEDSKKILTAVRDHVDKEICLSLMSQYFPSNRSSCFPEIDRTLQPEEYSEVVDHAVKIGFENILVQDPRESPKYLRPDFLNDHPFEQ
ncbi:radical SAM protein [candidate division WOR-3 bacterium]|nr:radical SAM protein [candidate division WOR-3 bacterium]